MARAAEGALIWAGERVHQVDATPVKAIDPNGAGDMFAGAYLYALTHGHDHATAGRLAAAASSRLVTEFGPRLPAEVDLEVRKQVLGE